MAFSVLSVFVAFGAVAGTSEGIQSSQRRARREEHRSRKNNLVVHCPKSSAYSPLLQGRRVVLSGNNCFVDTGDGDDSTPFGHSFAGYYLPYPEAGHAGLVSTITDVAPIMNWVFVDRTTYALCYGARAASQGQLTGPWDCTRQERRMTLCGWEGFVAVRFPPDTPGLGGLWVLFFDCDGDHLQARLATMPPGTVSVEIQLARRELKAERPITLAELEKMELERLEREKQAEEEKKAEQEGKIELTVEQVAELQKKLGEEERLKNTEGQNHGVPVPAENTTPEEGREIQRPPDISSTQEDAESEDRRGRDSTSNPSARSGSESPHRSIKSTSSRTTESRSSSVLDRAGADTDTDDGYSSSVCSNYFDDR
ncbi:hypothetical protein F503_01756 [Ophiostoma piceae UAMH 11346]|uniref:Uncharacterized protein n=1 Tax=Ophiostoma piceae (strain UAMH 11346) TaxID=1262450 RepID=S3BWQ8_OPHP1|nr:hypothetical protein F503_01756 [Ophiostoma piceae UAMH 11346]